MSVSELSHEVAHAASGNVPRRVALLARAGQAREQLRQALNEAGAQIVLEDDPNLVDAQQLLDASPQVVLVALEAATEDSLSRFDQVLHDPAVAVIYDEAELAAKREGWEAQRWARHLAAKLNGHGDVLPPGGESDAMQPQPGLPTTPAQIHAEARIEMHLEEAQDRASELPRGGLEVADAMPEATTGLYLDLEPEAWQPPAAAVADAVLNDGFGTSLVPDADTDIASEPAATAALQSAPESVHSVTLPASPAPKLALELEALEPVNKVAGARGALLIFAGIGGPDAVRKVLAELPPDLPRPVLVCLRLDGGRYDNLVKQMARVSTLPVELAKAGDTALASHVYVLPNDLSMQVREGIVHFIEGQGDVNALISSLPAPESGVLLLSGSHPDQVDPALALAAQGAFVAGQAAQGCYDPAASKALAARGGETGTPSELAARAVAHLGA